MRALVAVLSFSLVAFAADKSDQAKAYLNKKVVIKNAAFVIAVDRDGRYQQKGIIDWIPSSYIGKPATVIAVQEKESSAQGPKKLNALGEAVTGGEPQFDFVVRFEDGLLAMKTETLDGIRADVLMPDEVAALEAAQKANELKTKDLIGKPVFGTFLSKVYRPDVTLSEMLPKNQVPFPSLEPLIVQSAVWNKEVNCALVRVKMPDGSGGLAFARLDENDRCGNDPLFAQMPRFNSLEMKAVREHSVVRGMSEYALFHAIGMPQRENDYGKAGRQLIYGHGLIVYVDTEGKVEDAQRIPD